MSVLTPPAESQLPPGRLLTVADHAALPTELPSGPVHFELDNGRLVVAPRGHPLTVADHAALPTHLPSGPVHYELDNGRLVVMPPPGDTHGAVEANITTELKIQGDRRDLGKTRCGEVFVILWHHPDRVV